LESKDKDLAELGSKLLEKDETIDKLQASSSSFKELYTVQ
jgi:hypothetical protein